MPASPAKASWRPAGQRAGEQALRLRIAHVVAVAVPHAVLVLVVGAAVVDHDVGHRAARGAITGYAVGARVDACCTRGTQGSSKAVHGPAAGPENGSMRAAARQLPCATKA